MRRTTKKEYATESPITEIDVISNNPLFETSISRFSVLSGILILIGATSCFVWILFFSSSPVLFTSFSDSSWLFGFCVLVFSLSAACLRTLSAVLARHLDCVLQDKRFMIAMGITAAAMPILLFVTCRAGFSSDIVRALCVPQLIISAAGFVIISTLWIDLLKQFDDRIIGLIASACFILFPPCFYLFSALPSPSFVVFCTAMPITSCLCFTFAIKLRPLTKDISDNSSSSAHRQVLQGESSSDKPSRSTNLTFVARIFSLKEKVFLTLLPFGCFYCGIIGQVTRVSGWLSAPESIATFSLFHETGVFLSGVAIATYSLIKILHNWKGVNLPFAVVIMVVMALGIVIPGILDVESTSFSELLIGFGLGALQIQLVFYAAVMAKRRSVSAFFSFGLSYTALEFAAVVGSLCLPLIQEIVSIGAFRWGQIFLFAIFIFLVIIATMFAPFLLSQKSYSGEDGFDQNDSDKDGADGEQELSERLIATFGLTTRECEIAILLFKGRSLPFIQKKLAIAEGTARTHVVHIYHKTGVHSRQEFIDMVNSPSVNSSIAKSK